MVNYIMEHCSEDEKICSICHDEENPITKDNILVLNCCHIFHIGCGAKSLIETKLTCPLCRNLQNFPICVDGVYHKLMEHFIDNKSIDIITDILKKSHECINYMLEYSTLSGNYEILYDLEKYIEENNEIIDITLSNTVRLAVKCKQYIIIEYYIEKGYKDELLLYAIQEMDLRIIMYLIHHSNSDPYFRYDDVNLLSYAIRTGSIEIVTYLLYNCGVDVHIDDNQAIIEALGTNNYEMQKLLLENVVDPYHPDNTEHQEAYEIVIHNVRSLMIEYWITKIGISLFSRIIGGDYCINDKSLLELFESLHEKHSKINAAMEQLQLSNNTNDETEQ